MEKGIQGYRMSDPKSEFIYWIHERWNILQRKQHGDSKPWSSDPVFQKTYFCNVRREDDKVTKWIRGTYNPHVHDPMFEYNMVFARFINWPETLDKIGYLTAHNPEQLNQDLELIATQGKLWGGAYIVTTHGIPMSKVTYLCENVLGGAYRRFGGAYRWPLGASCAQAHHTLMQLEGLGPFLAAQVVADLKNTPEHELASAPDRDTFVSYGPGSLRGLSWFWFGQSGKITPSKFDQAFESLRDWLRPVWPVGVPEIDNQDLQNVLCEYSKYMKVKYGGGHSKRNYDGV
jgi:alpha-glutamyl/putrescinyl thymine pyrophosphorylase clade 1